MLALRSACISLVLIAVACVIAHAALPASDSFTRADSGTLGPNWTDSENGFGISSNTANARSLGNNNISYWSADVFGNDHYSQVTVSSLAGVTAVGVVCRANGAAPTNNGYLFYSSSIAGNIYKIVAGSYTSLAGSLTTVASGDVLKITCIGSLIEAFKNGISVGSVNDSSVAAGSAGIYGTSPLSQLINWSGDNIGSTPSPCYMTLLNIGCDDITILGTHRLLAPQ